MRSLPVRLVTLGALVALIVGCDQRAITAATPGGTGGTGGNGGSGASGAPIVSIDTPATKSLVNLGDSVLVAVRVRDAAGLKTLTVGGYSYRGDPNLGTLKVTQRYAALPAPVAGGTAIRTGAIDTVIRRYLVPVAPVDTTQDSVVVLAIATNVAGNVDTARATLMVVSGPKVTLLSPAPGDSVQRGISMSMQLRATHSEGISRVAVRVQGETNWPTKLDTTIVQTYSGQREVDFTASVLIPQDAPGRGRITITPSASDVNRIPGSSTPVVVYVRASAAPAPRVTQVVPARAEIADSVTITASGDGIVSVGLIVKDSAGVVVHRDSMVFNAPYSSPQRVAMSLGLDALQQGRRLTVSSFAIDRTGRYGYSIPANTSTPITDATRAYADSALIVHGRTYTLPRTGTAGDIAVDPTRGHVFVSNTSYNLLEVWRADQKAFTPNGVAVGAFPWGLAVSTDPNILLVANSGGTNISKVDISAADPSAMREAGRILTRNTYIYVVTEARDETTGKINFSARGPISYSDRPQYIAQSAGGRIYYSTRPTTFAPAGTIRWLDPSLPSPDPRQVWQYAQATSATPNTYVLFNVDSLSIYTYGANSPKSDILQVYDHPYGQSSGQIVEADTIIADLFVKLRTAGSDVDARNDVSVDQLALTDTTFVATSGDRKWVAFGEGNTKGVPSRILLVNDTLPAGGDFSKLYFSPRVTSQDIMENASEPMFGLALDARGKLLAAHGRQSYFSAIEQPFHLRLQGKFDTFDAGAGIAYHPQADVDPATPPGAGNTNLAFVASANGTIEFVDAYFYKMRGKIATKTNLYGPLRVTGPFPGDPPSVRLKLFGMSSRGLVVIDITDQDIKP